MEKSIGDKNEWETYGMLASIERDITYGLAEPRKAPNVSILDTSSTLPLWVLESRVHGSHEETRHWLSTC